MTNKGFSGSFRDPSGFVFTHGDCIYRQVNLSYKDDFDLLVNSGLYKELVDAEILISHDNADIGIKRSEKAYRIIKPVAVPFISYPYEWCFSQLKDAALTTLKIQKIALDFGMSLKDSSAYNVQFKNGKPIFIDTLSFKRYSEGEPWVAYRQFCQHFLAPLALMACRDIRLGQLLRTYIDGIPLDLASRLLPTRTRLNLGILTHIHIHARSQEFFADKFIKKESINAKMGRMSMLGLIDNLESAIKKLKWNPKGTEWADYYQDTNYTPEALRHKKTLVEEFLGTVNPGIVWDLGANVGIFSRIAAGKGARALSFDIDPAAVEKNYLNCVNENQTNILPLLLDLTNPTPGIGWLNQERASLLERGPADTVLALALIHHLAISNNSPFSMLANFFNRICHSLIIEFIPKDDSQAQKLLSAREDIFADYTEQAFEKEFRKYFTIQKSAGIKETKRTLYLMRKLDSFKGAV